VGAEVLKIRRQGMLWAMLGVAVLFFLVVTGAFSQADNFRQTLEKDPATFFFNQYEIFFTLFDTGSGIFLLILSARLVGMEYSGGTIRVLLGRGAGRLRLLLAKLTALALVGLTLLVGFLALTVGFLCLLVLSWEGSLSRLASLPAAARSDLGIVLLIALVSLTVSILIGTTAAVLGRSLAFGIGAALILFPADNFAVFVMRLLNGLTGWHFWLDATTFLLGPSLNVLPLVMETDHVVRAAFATPLVTVSAAHAWLVVGTWAVALAVTATALTWRRDVLQ
jgi:ABC-type transport system involved in multi-copper enzyme maturation permease subunit